jgi:hypothetical protein
MSPPNFFSNLLVLVNLNIRKLRILGRERRCEVAYSNVCIWDRATKRSFIGVMPVSAWRIVTFKYMNIVACLRELPIGNEPTEGPDEWLKWIRIAIRRTLDRRQ